MNMGSLHPDNEEVEEEVNDEKEINDVSLSHQDSSSTKLLSLLSSNNKSKNTNDNISLSIDEITKRLYHGVGLAPMVRASTIPLRTLAIQYGANFVYTEELIDRSISDTTRTVNPTLQTIDYVKSSSRLSAKQQRRLLLDAATNNNTIPPAVLLRIDRAVEQGKLICQIGTGDAEHALKAALHIHSSSPNSNNSNNSNNRTHTNNNNNNNVDAFDINMGCPKKFSTCGGMGSSLLSDPVRACSIIRTLAETFNPMKIPISAKIRLLKKNYPNSTSMKDGKMAVDIAGTVQFVTGLIEAGANAVAIHGRRVGDLDIENADWDSLREIVILLKSKYPSVPLLVNGDFYTRAEFQTFREETNADGVLLARPALYNTSLFRAPEQHEEDRTTTSSSSSIVYDYNSPLLLDKSRVIQDYIREAIKYDVNYRNVKYVTSEMMNSRRAPIDRVPFLKQSYVGGQTIGKVCACHSLPEICTVWGLQFNDLLRQNRGQSSFSSMIQAPTGDHTYSDDYILRQQQQYQQQDNVMECQQNHSSSIVTTSPHDNNKPTATTSDSVVQDDVVVVVDDDYTKNRSDNDAERCRKRLRIE